MEMLYRDADLLVCVKPAGVLSTDEPGGMPELVRAALGEASLPLFTVHRLDRVVGGLMVLARSAEAASLLSAQIREGHFEKAYLAVVRGLCGDGGELRDLLWRDKARKMTFVADAPGKGVQEAVLRYDTLAREAESNLVRVELLTGRTHQIRVQFASRGLPLLGERKYAQPQGEERLALWSYRVAFAHPRTGRDMVFSLRPPAVPPWTVYEKTLNSLD